MPDWRVVPIQSWPGEPTVERRSSPFGRWQSGRGTVINWSDTMDKLDRELFHLDAENVVLQMAVRDRDIRIDGWIRANASPADPGVILTFDSVHGPLSYPCDTFTDWKSNLRAIVLALESLRRVDRYNVARRGEQYTGWKRLPAQTANGSAEILAQHSGMTVAEVRANPKQAYRRAARTTHPDTGGSQEAFARVAGAFEALGVGHG